MAAYRYDDPDRVLNIVLLSDGMTDESEQQQLLQLIGQRPAGARVFCIGVGNDVNRPLLSQLAQQAGGLSAFISRGDSFARAAAAFRRKLLRPAVTNVRFRFAGLEVYDLEPERLPNLFHGAPMRYYGRYKTGGRGTVTFSGDVLGQSIEQTVELNFPQENATNPEIDRMWAFRRVEQLMRAGRQRGQFDASEIVRLCEEYSIISEYASFIVLENDGEYRRWKIERRNVNRISRDRAARAQINRDLAELRERSMQQIGPSHSLDNQAPGVTIASAVPTTATDSPTPTDSPRSAPSASSRGNSDRGFDIQITNGQTRGRGRGGGGGGGAIDPISGTIALGMAAAAMAARRRRRKCKGDEADRDGSDT